MHVLTSRRSASRHRQRLARVEECIPLCWRSTSTDYEKIPSVCSQSTDTTVDVGILFGLLWELSGFVLDADAACSHFDNGCTAVPSWRCQCTKDACRWQCWSVTITCMAILSRRWAESRLRGRVRAWIEACRVRASPCSLGVPRALVRILCSVEQRGTWRRGRLCCLCASSEVV